ncbi:MAG: hypothetical protein Q9159_006176 [Coniocarpon cinnabarinum]
MEPGDDQENVPHSSQTFLPSSPLAPSSTHSSTKPRKPPSVTPRRFGRFFTPRSNASSSSRGARQLRDITRNANNRAVGPLVFDDVDNRPRKRRRPSPEAFQSSPPDGHEQPLSSPCGPAVEHWSEGEEQDGDDEEEETEEYPVRVQKARTRLIYNQPQPRTRYTSLYAGWNLPSPFANQPYYTTPSSSRHRYRALDNSIHDPVPFTVAATNTSTLIATATDDGYLRILDTAPNADFNQNYLFFRPHSNAIMDIDFSFDDNLVATGSGDQSACITDMMVQTPLLDLPEHSSSLKQVRWKPGSISTLATCSRDGMICLWDIRSNNSLVAGVPCEVGLTHSLMPPPIPSANPAGTPSSHPSPSSTNRTLLPSITAMTFLPSNPNLLVTATDSSAHLYTWDIRMPSRRNLSTRASSSTYANSLSITEPPETHRRRTWGITSLCISQSTQKLFAVCRDSKIYAYATSHLALGGVPSYSASPNRKLKHGNTRSGAAPLYALRNSAFRCDSFYIRGACDPAGETLAVGSGANCAVVLPTSDPVIYTDDNPDDNLPIYETGHPLVGGHTHEVTAVTFARGAERYDKPLDLRSDCDGEQNMGVDECEDMKTSFEGPLVTTSDDGTARLWRRHRYWGPRARPGRVGLGWEIGWGWEGGWGNESEG